MGLYVWWNGTVGWMEKITSGLLRASWLSVQPEGCWVAWVFFLISLKTKLHDEPGKNMKKSFVLKTNKTKYTGIYTEVTRNPSVTSSRVPSACSELDEILLSHEYEVFSKCICW